MVAKFSSAFIPHFLWVPDDHKTAYLKCPQWIPHYHLKVKKAIDFFTSTPTNETMTAMQPTVGETYGLLPSTLTLI